MLLINYVGVIFVAGAWLPYSQATRCGYSCPQGYKTKCGFLNLNRCTRYRDITCYRCCAGWQGSTSNGCPDPICFGSTSCPNGGYCNTPDNCINCNRGYYSPRCNRCTRISNCLEAYCSSSSNQKCDRCNGDYGAALGSAYTKSSDQRRCIKQCSWRSDSNACYPGSCTDARCTCRSGFSGTDCRTINTNQSPNLPEHRATLMKGTTTIESPTVQGSTATIYTNVRDFTSIRINWKSSYQPTGLPNPSAIPYIHSAGLGITAASVTAVVNRGSSTVYLIGTEACSTSTTGTNFNRDSPAIALVTCQKTFTLNYNTWTPTTGDVLRYNVQASNGGYLKLYNRDSNKNINTRHYRGRTTLRYSTFTFDFVPPAHCMDVDGECQTSMLNVGNDVTKQARIRVTWQSWTDNLAGIKEYDLAVRQLSGSRGSEMSEDYTSSPVYSGVTNSGRIITLPHTGVYSFVLTAVDNAGNVRHSRRFVLLDDSDITIQHDSPITVQSATVRGDICLTNVSPPGRTTPVTIDWTNHFVNVQHHSQGLLKHIGAYRTSSIDSSYDQNFGQRGRAGIPNVLGVTEFRVFTDFNRRGESSIVKPSNSNSDTWRNEGRNTQTTLDLNIRDGDSIRVWVEARDIAGNSVRDSVLIHADSSPPSIKNSEVNGNGDFRAYDGDSGLESIDWHLVDSHTGREVQHGSKVVSATQINNAYLRGPSITQTWTRCGGTTEARVEWSGLGLVNDALIYSLSTRATNQAGMATMATSQNITANLSAGPNARANTLIMSYRFNEGAILEWGRLFTSSSSLVYEVSVGSTPGGSDILQAVETMETGISVSPLARNTDSYLNVTAISSAGLTHTVTETLNVP